MNDQIEVRDLRQPGFHIVDNEIIEVHGPKIGPYGIAVYCAIAMEAGKRGACEASVATLAGRIGCSVRKVRDTVAVLESVGLIGIELRPTGRGMQHLPSIYTVLQVVKLPKYTGRGTAQNAVGTAPGAEGVRHDVPKGTAPGAYSLRIQETQDKRIAATDVASRRNGHKAAGDGGQSKATESAGAKEPPDPRVQIVVDMYAAALGYAVPNGGAQAGAAKWMLKQGYTPEQIMACYRRMKADPFWQGRALSLVSVKGQIGEQVHAQSATSWVIG